MSPDYSENTLPTLRDVVAESQSVPQLRCTIVYHPRRARIGQSAILHSQNGHYLLGRASPLFMGDGQESGLPLEDPYVSRRALLLQESDDGIRLSRPAEASRCQVAGHEVQGETLVDNRALEQGVPLLLSHSVVLVLRRVQLPTDEPCCIESALLGVSSEITRLQEQIRRAADSDLDVLIRGETGVGKELVAQAIHQNSRRSGVAMVSVNMAAIPPSLAAAFLFGSTRGAYTGADKARAGYFQQAQGGSLFLDEVGDTPEEVQPLLLRALQQREVQVVGGDTRKVDVRVISATDALLDEEACGFKSALRYRLGALEIQVPPLRARTEDIGVLLLNSLQRTAEREGRAQWLAQSMTDASCVARWAQLFYRFCNYAWPGNVRQLENFAAQVIMASDERPVLPEALAHALAPTAETDSSGAVADQALGRRKSGEVSEAEFEAAMHEERYEVAAVAQRLGISRSALYRRIEKSTQFRSAADVPMAEINAALAECDNDLRSTALGLQVSESGLRQRLRSIRASA